MHADADEQGLQQVRRRRRLLLAPGGGFEGTHGWKLTTGASIVSGNDNLGITSGSKSLQLAPGGTATSPAFCVDDSLPSFRFGARVSSLDGGYIAVVIYRNAQGTITNAQFTSSGDGDYWNGASAWNPSAISPLASQIPLNGGTASVQLMFVGTMKAYGIVRRLQGVHRFGDGRPVPSRLIRATPPTS